MAFKQLGAIDITQSTWTTLYTVPSGKTAIVSKAKIINQNTSSDATMYLAHIPSGGSVSAKYYLIPGNTVLKNGGQCEENNIAMATGDILQVYSNQANGTAYACGDET